MPGVRRCTALTGPLASSVDRAGLDVPRAEPRGPRASAAARAQPRADPARAGADGRPAGAVRARRCTSGSGRGSRGCERDALTGRSSAGRWSRGRCCARRSTSSPGATGGRSPSPSGRHGGRGGCGPGAAPSRRPTMERAAARLRERLGDDPMPRKAIVELVGRERFEGIGLWVDLVRAPPSGTWERRRADLFADAERWAGPCDAASARPRSSCSPGAISARFGPATAAEFADWAGLPPHGRADGRRARGDAALPGRGRRRAPRPAARAAARPGDARAGPLPADLGRDAARARPAGADHRRGGPARASSRRRRRSRSRRSSSTAGSRGPGVTRTGGSRSGRSGASTPRTAAPSRRRASGSRPSTPSARPASARGAAARSGPRCAAARPAAGPTRRPRARRERRSSASARSAVSSAARRSSGSTTRPTRADSAR